MRTALELLGDRYSPDGDNSPEAVEMMEYLAGRAREEMLEAAAVFAEQFIGAHPQLVAMLRALPTKATP